MDVQVTELRKSYGPTRALDSVTVTFQGGSVHTVLGEKLHDPGLIEPR